MSEGAAHDARRGETAIDGVITLDESATILSFNPAAEHIYGIASAEIIGRSFADLDVSTRRRRRRRRRTATATATATEVSPYLRPGAREGRVVAGTARRFPAIST